jgi:hypothetical protein
MIVGWRVAAHMRTTIVLDAIEMALSERQHITTNQRDDIHIEPPNEFYVHYSTSTQPK